MKLKVGMKFINKENCYLINNITNKRIYYTCYKKNEDRLYNDSLSVEYFIQCIKTNVIWEDTEVSNILFGK